MKECNSLILFIFIFLGCSSETSFKDCIHGKPKPLFFEKSFDVKEHSFKIKKEESIESIKFTDGMLLTIKQSGCEIFTQEFEFKIVRDSFPFFNSYDWKKHGIQLLKNLSSRGNEYIAYQSWANLLENKIDEMNGENLAEISSGFFASIQVTEDSLFQKIVIVLTEGN